MRELVQRSKTVVKTFFLRIFRQGIPVRVSTINGLPFNATTSPTGPTFNFLPNAHHFIVTNPIIYYVPGDRDIITPAIKSLSECTLNGAEFDSSIRDPPPRCHPGTRVILNDKIHQWFRDQERQRSLLWLNGPAGVGKSAVIQNFAETLATSKHLGASLFFSRHHNRQDPHKVFTTIGFQLAIRIHSYREFVAEQIALDPSLLKKGMIEQFRVFIAEPFGVRGIGTGSGPLGVLLDGLDECEGMDHQREIVQLISGFILKFPRSPLVWAIASRPEPHLTAVFTVEPVASSHWAEYMPIDSTEACQDVERYLRASFKSVQKRFSHIPSAWPSEGQFLKLVNGASGLFVFATTVVRFIGNADFADPISRLNLIVAVVDRAGVIVTSDHPFALLDALYAEILKSIPTALWHITKRILGFALCARGIRSAGPVLHLKSQSIVAASTILEVEQSIVYASLHKLHSVLQIPHPKHAYKSRISFLHASFADYLTDPTRSKELFICPDISVDDLIRGLYSIYLKKPWNHKSRTVELSRGDKEKFYRDLKFDAGAALYYVVTGDLKDARGRGPFVSLEDRTECLDALAQINTAEIYINGYHPEKFIEWLFKLWQHFREELEGRKLIRFSRLQDLRFDHIDHEGNRPFLVFSGGVAKNSSPNSSQSAQKFIAELEALRRYSPNTRVLICGSSPEKRCAFFYHTLRDWGNHWTEGSYCLPYRG